MGPTVDCRWIVRGGVDSCTLRNSVAIGQIFAEIWQFNSFPNGGRLPTLISKSSNVYV